jgi:hypothetical protein
MPSEMNLEDVWSSGDGWLDDGWCLVRCATRALTYVLRRKK